MSTWNNILTKDSHDGLTTNLHGPIINKGNWHKSSTDGYLGTLEANRNITHSLKVFKLKAGHKNTHHSILYFKSIKSKEIIIFIKIYAVISS